MAAIPSDHGNAARFYARYRRLATVSVNANPAPAEPIRWRRLTPLAIERSAGGGEAA